MPAQKEIGVSSKISGIDGAPSAAQIASVGAGRPVQRSQDTVSGGTNSDTSKDGSQNVQITGTARQLADLDQKVRDLPDVNEERVSQLRTAIEQGTYQVRASTRQSARRRRVGHFRKVNNGCCRH
jgi:negative regulator of flagellin synthesis FlgM